MAQKMNRRCLVHWLLVGWLGLALTACGDKIRTGVVVKDYQLEMLKVGKSSYQEVIDILGTPTSISTYDQRIWYYTSQTKSHRAFLNASVDSQEIYQIRFNSDGIYAGYRLYTDVDAVALTVSQQTTPTVARDKSFWQEVVSNFGRYGKSGDDKTPGVVNPARNIFNSLR